ncbi:MAG: hypothetical protein K2G91_09660 [Prevotella sp.]|nr:hypothetical protein [Prevotella sp.]
MKHRQSISSYWSILLILVLTPLLLWAAITILPTHDDWAGTTKPSFEPFFIKERFLFYGYHWRPFDTMVGYVAGLNPQTLYPAFNHCLVVIGHLVNSLLIFKLITAIGLNKNAANIATAFFFITPATMATVLAVDSQNQTYALMWDIIAFLIYIKQKKDKYILWTISIFLATWSKENGLMWAVICPILAYGFNFIEKKQLRKDLLIGICIMVVYALAIWLLPKQMIIHPEYVPDPLKTISGFIKFFFSSFITVDYIWLLHQPSRNLLLASITVILTIPFMYYIYIRQLKLIKDRKIVCTLISLLIAAAPHIFTVFSMMHTYGGLVFVVLIIAISVNNYSYQCKAIIISFAFFALSAFAINIHLWHESYLSGLTGKQMAIDAIQKTGEPVDSVYVIIIEDDYPKLSSFCVIPSDAFGWGRATQYETNYDWPKVVNDTIITRNKQSFQTANQLAALQLKDGTYNCVWIVDHKNITVIRNDIYDKEKLH